MKILKTYKQLFESKKGEFLNDIIANLTNNQSFSDLKELMETNTDVYADKNTDNTIRIYNLIHHVVVYYTLNTTKNHLFTYDDLLLKKVCYLLEFDEKGGVYENMLKAISQIIYNNIENIRSTISDSYITNLMNCLLDKDTIFVEEFNKFSVDKIHQIIKKDDVINTIPYLLQFVIDNINVSDELKSKFQNHLDLIEAKNKSKEFNL